MARLAALLLLALSAFPAQACKVALALTIDVSGSISPAEYRLQMNGLASALEDPTVADALIAAKAHVTTIHWSGASRQMVTIPWREMEARQDVAKLATDVRSIERPWRNFSTAIGQMLEITGPLFDDRPCERFVIDVSGDGVSNEGAPPDVLRDQLVANSIQINALAILGESDTDLPAYYRGHVIGGTGAFVYIAKDFEDYPRAIRRKLLDEITEPVS